MKKLETMMSRYEEQFEDAFPLFCFMHLSPGETIDLIEQCLDEGKDVYELGILADDSNVKY